MYGSNTNLLITLNIDAFSRSMLIWYFLHVIEIVIIILFQRVFQYYSAGKKGNFSYCKTINYYLASRILGLTPVFDH